VIERFVGYVEVGEIGSAIDLLSSDTTLSADIDGIQAVLCASSGEIQSMGGIEQVSVQILDCSEENARARMTIWYADHKSETDMVDLVKETGEWRVSLLTGVSTFEQAGAEVASTT
jgi:hypothetical protein